MSNHAHPIAQIGPWCGDPDGVAARVIADSITPWDHRLTTIEARHHRFVLAEENTHRTFSRNSASSRAIPLRRADGRGTLDKVEANPAWPLVWPREQPGMSGGADLDGDDLAEAETLFQAARDVMMLVVDDYVETHPDKEHRLHKSLLNRLLEPFGWHQVIITATAFDNFFHQRCHPAAQPEMRAVAERIQEAMAASTPQVLQPGEYHLPWIDAEDWEWARERALDGPDEIGAMKALSTARCARVSLENQDGVRDRLSDLGLYERLIGQDPMHASPLEHVATPAPWNIDEVALIREGGTIVPITPIAATMRNGFTLTLPRVGNFLGWAQHRLEVEVDRRLASFR